MQADGLERFHDELVMLDAFCVGLFGQGFPRRFDVDVAEPGEALLPRPLASHEHQDLYQDIQYFSKDIEDAFQEG